MLLATLVLMAWTSTTAQDGIINFRQYSPALASAGQPTAHQLRELQEEGYERIIYIAFSDHENSLRHEDRIVKELGMEYVQIPVDWNAPRREEFEAVSAALADDPNRKTLLHCQVNYRASAFAFLHRVVRGGVSVEKAKADMNAIWRPNAVWRDFIFDTLRAHGVDPECDGCDWSVPDH